MYSMFIILRHYGESLCIEVATALVENAPSESALAQANKVRVFHFIGLHPIS
jgi:hypothetical protein